MVVRIYRYLPNEHELHQATASHDFTDCGLPLYWTKPVTNNHVQPDTNMCLDCFDLEWPELWDDLKEDLRDPYPNPARSTGDVADRDFMHEHRPEG